MSSVSTHAQIRLVTAAVVGAVLCVAAWWPGLRKRTRRKVVRVSHAVQSDHTARCLTRMAHAISIWLMLLPCMDVPCHFCTRQVISVV